tara:strand:- start:533 stop:652 length:120 start_codon:yes stop_codon:yes gene_type:complete
MELIPHAVLAEKKDNEEKKLILYPIGIVIHNNKTYFCIK